VSERPTIVPEIPAISTVQDPATRRVLEAMRESIMIGEGRRGDQLDQKVTFRDLVAAGVVSIPGISGGSLPGRPGVPPIQPQPDGTLDLTPAPTVANLRTTAGLKSIFIEWNAPVYPQGGGNAFTIIYGAINTGVPPTFANASPIGQASGVSTMFSFPANPGVQWRFWAKHVTEAGQLSTQPAGGTNGVIGQAGVIGNTDLGPLIVTAENLSQGTYPGMNLVPNPGAEDGTAAWYVPGFDASGAGVTFAADTAVKTGGAASFRLRKTSTGDGGSALCRAFPVIPGETYSVRVTVRGSATTGAGLFVRMNEFAANPPGGVATTRLSLTDFAANAPVPSAFTKLEYTYTVPAGVFYAGLSVINWIGGPLDLWFDDCNVGRQITASSIAAGSIAVGTAAIQNGAIVNAMIGNAAIDDAKIANLSAAKVTFGEMSGDRVSVNTFNGNRVIVNTVNGNVVIGNTLQGNAIIGNTVDASRLTVGVRAGASSMFENSDFTDETGSTGGAVALRNWVYYDEGVLSPQLGRNFQAGVRYNVGRGGAWLFSGPSASRHALVQRRAVTSGVAYEFHFSGSVFRASAYIQVNWVNSSGVSIASIQSATINAGSGAVGSDLTPDVLSWVSDVAPVNAVFADVYFFKTGATVGQADSYLFLHRCFMAPLAAGASATNPTRWTSNQTTTIDAKGIVTPSLSAITANIGTVTAGTVRNSTDTANINLDATGAQIFMRAGPLQNRGSLGLHYSVEVQADGTAFFDRLFVGSGSPKKWNDNDSIPLASRPAVWFSAFADAYVPPPPGGGRTEDTGP
jgi:hypothetical protein